MDAITLTLSIISIILSILSIIVTVVLAVITYKQVFKINDINSKAVYYNKIFDQYLIELIPDARKYIRFSNERLTDINMLIDVLSQLRNSALYFKYNDLDFYNKIKDITQDIENYLVECSNKSFEPEEQAMVFQEIQEKIHNLYECVNNSYLGH